MWERAARGAEREGVRLGAGWVWGAGGQYLWPDLVSFILQRYPVFDLIDMPYVR